MPIEPFRIHVPDADLDDLQRRLALTRWPDEIPGSAWDYGTNLDYLKGLVAYWRDGFDWRKQERFLNSFPHFKADVDGLGVHFIHVKGKGPRPVPLILSHGWPSTFFEMHKVIGPLTDPEDHGGDPADAFDVVAPSLPGYGFSDKPTVRGFNVARVGELFNRLMTQELGYRRYVAQGGDWGGQTTNRLGYAYPENVIAISLTRALARSVGDLPREPTPQDKERRRKLERFQAEEYGYTAIQRTKPNTLGLGLNDSPAGLAAWIVEKFRRWSDCEGDVESVHTKDELLTNVMLFWVTQTTTSAARLYYEDWHNPTPVPKGERVTVPMGVVFFPKDFAPPPRAGAELVYSDIRRWTVMPNGGHFAALEKPKELVDEIRALVRPLR